MYYIKINNNTIEDYSIEQLKKEYPDVSFPEKINSDILKQYGVYSVTVLEMPIYDAGKEFIELSKPYKENDKWFVKYNIHPIPERELSSAVRDNRNILLSESDWIVSRSYEQNVPVPPEWASYRQQLRDITNQSGFPFDVIWPKKPE